MKRLFCGFVTLALLLRGAGPAQSDFIYWSDYRNPGAIHRSNLDGTGVTTLVSGMEQPTGPTLDAAGGLMYWGNFGGKDIRRSNLDGTGQTILVSGLTGACPPALDLANGKMYWADGPSGPGDIRMANLDGTGQITLINGLNNGPRTPALDLVHGTMYWADRNGGGGTIERANFDGTGRTTLVNGLEGPQFVALDLADGKMYWANSEANTIMRSNLDGSDPEVLVKNLRTPVGLALNLRDGLMYWTESADEQGGLGANLGDIGVANLDGSNVQTLLTGLMSPIYISLDLSAPAPITVTGYSSDVISDIDPQARFAQSFNSGTFAWFEAGAVDDAGTQHTDGLPASLTFVSATGSNATYQIQPANGSSVLQLSAGQTGTLTLYSTLYILASSGDGAPTSSGSGNINFADGRTQAFSYNTFDWCNGPYGQGGIHSEATLPVPTGRADVGPNGTAFVYNQDCDFQIYETVLAIDPSHAGVAIASIDFTGAPDAYFSNIFGVSAK
jgi:hypothetical protein